ncbi:MAG: RsmD family RNA methyltransferase [Treponema sp.]|jgi:16S rRNA (guanine(966)-N(2))-methyltransferase RsmD|nr:RsmD family RNA methyltransferase [Treponema sp.]
MRITGGALKGRIVKVPPGRIRPAMDRMRESIFGVLGDLAGLSFLDLFSGSGIVALEAASRGAAPVEAVEGDPLKRAVLIENAALSPLRIQCRFMAVELYVRCASRASRVRRAFDLIFCDPPFPYRFKNDLLRGLAASPLVRPGTRILMHRPAKESVIAAPPLLLRETRLYGRSAVDWWYIDENTALH